MLNVIARMILKPGKKEEFLKLFKANVPKVLAEEGCLGYAPCTDLAAGLGNQAPVDENAVTVLECWENLQCLQRHLASPHMKAYAQEVKDRNLRESVTLTIVEPAE